MLTIIHGADTAASRIFFLEQKSKVSNPISLGGENVNLTDLAQILEGGELFATEKNVFIEQLLGKKKKSKERDTIIEFLNKQAIEHAVVLWEDKELDRTTLNAFKKATVRDFKLPQTLFALLDSLRPENGKQMITLFHKTIATAQPEMIFFMLVRQFRLLLALSSFSPSPNLSPQGRGTQTGKISPSPLVGEGRGEGVALQDNQPIDEVKRMAPWQRTKLENQAKLFAGKAQDFAPLREIYQKLFEIEKAQKTGTLPAPLTTTIDFFLLEI